jgi:mannose-6-phosphate isomerase-like protein (cupin superfamily)
MVNVQAYIKSGYLEQYCFGPFDAKLADEVNRLSLIYPEIKLELNAIELTLERLAQSQAVTPNHKLRTRILSALNLANEPLDVNHLPPTSQFSDHQAWFAAVEHLIPAEPFDDFFAVLLQQNEKIAQTLVITKLNVPEEVHEVISESFFILKGTCTCTVGKDSFTLNAGDHLNIPLHTNHDIRIDSPYVIAILQHQFA